MGLIGSGRPRANVLPSTWRRLILILTTGLSFDYESEQVGSLDDLAVQSPASCTVRESSSPRTARGCRLLLGPAKAGFAASISSTLDRPIRDPRERNRVFCAPGLSRANLSIVDGGLSQILQKGDRSHRHVKSAILESEATEHAASPGTLGMRRKRRSVTASRNTYQFFLSINSENKKNP